jgi:hypothetical protein
MCQHDEIVKSLTAILVELRMMNLQQQEFNTRQVAMNEDVKTTLARVKRSWPGSLRCRARSHTPSPGAGVWHGIAARG